MGILRRPGKDKDYDDEFRKYEYKSYNYTNKDAVEKVIRYITRTRKNETERNSLISVGSMGISYYMSSEIMIHQMEMVQNVYDIDKRGGRRIAHEVFLLSSEDLFLLGCNYALIYDMAFAMSSHYYQQGHQVVFAIHKDKDRVHIHFAINTINFINGLKWHDSKVIKDEREAIFNQVLREYTVWYYHQTHKYQAISFI